jgi:TIGR03009 family protein
MRTFAICRFVAFFTLCTVAAQPAAAQQQSVTGQAQAVPAQQPLAPAVQPQAQPGVQQPVAPVPAQAPPGFQLNQLQDAMLSQVLDAWQTQSAKYDNFKCEFERWEYNAFSSKVNNEEVPLNKCLGEVSYKKPDQGSFQIKQIRTFKTNPPAPGQAPDAPVTADWVEQPNAVGEHWVCNGKSVFEYRHHAKELLERPIPPQLQGKAIVDGPLPFLFGAEAAKLRAKYWLRVEQQPNQAEIWLTALPRYQAQAADYSKIEVILDRQRLLPKAMRVQMPDGSRHVYMFKIEGATVNNPLINIQALFGRPPKPFGWKHVIEQPPVAQAANPEKPAVK